MAVDKFFSTEITLNSKNLHNLQHSQVIGAMEMTTLARPKLINRLARNQNFSHFTVGFLSFLSRLTYQCLNSLGKHTTKSTSTEMLNYNNCQIESVADRLTQRTTPRTSHQTKILYTSPLGSLSCHSRETN